MSSASDLCNTVSTNGLQLQPLVQDDDLSSEADETFTLQELRVAYGRKQVLRGANLSAKMGEVVAVIGPNGAGKSTLLKAALGLLPVISGTVRLCARDLTRLDVYQRTLAGLGMMLQAGVVFPSLEVRENLEVAAMGLKGKARALAVEEATELVSGVRTLWSRRAGHLSGGQRQSLALAMALTRSPRVLLLDEPTAGLSPLLAREFLALVRDLPRHRRMVVILVEQRIRDALEIATRAAVMVEGAVVSNTAAPAEWLERGALDRYFFESFGRFTQGPPVA